MLLFSLMLPGRENAATLSGVQEGFLYHGTSHRGQWINESKPDPWQLREIKPEPTIHPRPPSSERKDKHLPWIRHHHFRFTGTHIWTKSYSWHMFLPVFFWRQCLPHLVIFKHISSFPFSWLVARPLCSPFVRFLCKGYNIRSLKFSNALSASKSSILVRKLILKYYNSKSTSFLQNFSHYVVSYDAQ